MFFYYISSQTVATKEITTPHSFGVHTPWQIGSSKNEFSFFAPLVVFFSPDPLTNVFRSSPTSFDSHMKFERSPWTFFLPGLEKEKHYGVRGKRNWVYFDENVKGNALMQLFLKVILFQLSFRYWKIVSRKWSQKRHFIWYWKYIEVIKLLMKIFWKAWNIFIISSLTFEFQDIV